MAQSEKLTQVDLNLIALKHLLKVSTNGYKLPHTTILKQNGLIAYSVDQITLNPTKKESKVITPRRIRGKALVFEAWGGNLSATVRVNSNNPLKHAGNLYDHILKANTPTAFYMLSTINQTGSLSFNPITHEVKLTVHKCDAFSNPQLNKPVYGIALTPISRFSWVHSLRFLN
ncbi:MAG: hypothetical protein M3P33_04390 [bacterium]|nr:hypothetical protein [bacterium]